MHHVVNILQLAFTYILEGNAELDETAARVFLHSARYTDTTSFRQFFQPRSHVYSVTMDASALYDIPDVDAYPEFDLPIWRYLRIPLGHCALDLHRAMQGVHGTNEQDQQAVASCPYDPTSVLLNLGFNELSMVSVQLG
jgi:hypothetical protein